ncbi:bacterial alpha-l-rhamnosidase domain protein [Colletotrichum truncatum]|uniref:Bacterial alpha-l-rhamnosidase domain protein n=1 Tax=Colletotrichum truncatum TaxID=5467 RepID=A0ACC3ZF25_COLTU|nr:bacterial alpha-l-rhamnosidase domain protein [Colletotrichum truncatum]KAF6801630.1 bacterial alpha-l-rhamnosidase domain protein [Colletotrichum truncatum]
MAAVTDVQFEHYHPPNTIGVHETTPRLSWKISNSPSNFRQSGYEVELSEHEALKGQQHVATAKIVSSQSTLVPWPFEKPLQSRQKISVRVRAWDESHQTTPWSEPSSLEVGLLDRQEWQCKRIAAPWGPGTSAPDPEQLFRKEFSTSGPVAQARLFITAQGVYEAEINGQRVGDYFLAPGWTTYEGRLQYQTYDVTALISKDDPSNCIGVRVAEGWFSGRIGFAGGHRNIWGPHTALIAQLELTFEDGHTETIGSDGSWHVTKGPIRLAEIYDGEKYDATLEIPGWSLPNNNKGFGDAQWDPVLVLPFLPESTALTSGYGEPVRRIEIVKPVEKITTPSGKTILDFGQNLVGYLRLTNIKGPRGHKIILSHAEVLENGELGTRPLRICKAVDEYTLKGAAEGEHYEPRFTFHGFRYAQIEGWHGEGDLMSSVEAVVCHTDMKPVGSFSCSDELLNKLYQNITWGMRGNFLSVPTDCPQRDERLGWSGDLALFAPTASLIYDCYGMLKNWLIDLEYDQGVLNGVPPMVSPNSTLPDPIWCRRIPCAIWHDVTILGPWALYQETGDKSILAQQYNSMLTWMKVLPRNKSGATHLWDPVVFQLGDWLDPAAPPNAPWKSPTDARMVANMFLIQSLNLIARISGILGQDAKKAEFEQEAEAAKAQFHEEYVTQNGRVVSDTQAAYALAICLDILTPSQRERAGTRLVELVRKNNFKIATGFAGTPFVCEALFATGNVQVAYRMLLEKECPSWLYPITMGATTVWERWDAMLPDGSINPGEMTSFNHYAFGAIARFLFERVSGLQRLEPGWAKCRVAPIIGAEFSHASASHLTRYGNIDCSWQTTKNEQGGEILNLKVSLPYGVTAEIILPNEASEKTEVTGPGEWTFQTEIKRDYEWPVLPLPPKS